MSGLQRRAPMRRTPLVNRAPLKATPRRATRSRDTGPSKAVRDLLWLRCGGRCELCDRPLAGKPWSRHHRLPRRMGGTRRPAVNTVANLLAVCGTGTTGCHGRIEANRRVARAAGWLLSDHQDPAATPVELTRGLVLLDTEAHYLPAPTAQGDQ